MREARIAFEICDELAQADELLGGARFHAGEAATLARSGGELAHLAIARAQAREAAARLERALAISQGREVARLLLKGDA